MSTNDPWKWMEEAFQALAYWQGYQNKRFRHYPIREIAVVTELAALLHAPAIQRGLQVDCECTFPKILEKSPDSMAEHRQKRVDLALRSKSKLESRISHVIEVKVIDQIVLGRSQKWTCDLERLLWLKQERQDLEIRVLILIDKPVPGDWLTEKGRSVRSLHRLQEQPDIAYRFRRLLRALPLLPTVDGSGRLQLNRGPCVVLLEPFLLGASE